ncbi:MAG: M16 family metallopeptidase [Gemmatimonadota bacterium]
MTGNELLDRIRPVEHRLANGLTLLVREDHTAPVVAIVTHVRAGYFDEPDRLVGISHVLEHMFFKGTEERGVGEIARQTKSAGGYLNAGTIYDHTSYYTVLPAMAVDMGLEIQADALLNSQIDEDELRKELLVIIQEVNRKLDTPSALAAEKLYEAMFDVHPMRRWRMGTEEGLQRLERGDVLDYYRRMYRGGNTTLAVSGDVDPARVIESVERLYETLPGGEPERRERSEPPRSGARYRELAGDVGHAYGEIGWRVPGALHEDTPALDALSVVLGQGRASRLYRGVRERGLASSIDAYNYTPGEIGVFGISLEAEPERVPAALASTVREVDRVRERPVSDAALDRVRTLLQARMLRRLETAEGQANLLAEWEALGGWRLMGSFFERIRTLDAGEVRRVAGLHLDPDDMTLLVYRPEQADAIGWADADLPGVLRDGDGVGATGQPEGWAGTRVAAAEAVERAGALTVPAPVVPGGARAEDGILQYDLDGGRLVVMPRSRAPLVSMSVTRRGGVLHEEVDSAGITGLMMRSSVKGTVSRSAARIARESEALGGAIGASAGSDLLSWSLTVPSEHFRAGFELLTEVALRPSFPEEEVARERDVLLADLQQLRDDMYRYPLRLLLMAAFGGHPYGFGPDQVADAVPRLDAGALRSWHAAELAEPWVYVVGDVDPARVAEAVAAAVGTPTRAIRLREPRPAWPTEPVARTVDRDRAQTALAVAFPGPDRQDDDRIALQVLANAISGLGNRLFEELRSRRSLAYTVNAFPLTRRHGGAFVGYIATSPDRAAEARQRLRDELLRIRDEPPSEAALERARNYTVGAWQIRTQTNAAQLSQLTGALMLGQGLEEIRTFEARVRAVTRDDVKAAARRWFDPDRMMEGAVYGRD